MMSWRLTCLAPIFTVGLFVEPAEAGFYSGNELLNVCSTDRDDPTYFEKTYECVAYISGAVDAFNTTREANGLKKCIPAKVTINQLKDVTVRYLEANPVDRRNSASSLVFAGTRKAWPCAKARKKRN